MRTTKNYTSNGLNKEYQQKTNYKSDYKPTPEPKKEYNKREYLKRKEKLKFEMDEKHDNENI